MRIAAWTVVAVVAMAFSEVVQAQTGASLPLVIGSGAGGTSYSVPIQTLLFFTALSFLPAILLMMTGFTRIVIVLSLLRQAIGTQSAPPNQVIIGLSLLLSLVARRRAARLASRAAFAGPLGTRPVAAR